MPENKGKLRTKARNFQFVLTKQEDLKCFIEWYRNEYKKEATIKEKMTDLNCAYALKNEEIFLVALNDNADYFSLQKWDWIEFIGVLKKTGEIFEVRCSRKGNDGSFDIDYRKGPVHENWKLISDAIVYYRNQAARKQFFDLYEKNNGETISSLKRRKNKELMESFKRVYEAEYQRIGDTILSSSLKELLDFCELRGGAYGYRNTRYFEPATDSEITSWEKENGINLPEEYKCFLRFADGAEFLSGSELLFGLWGIQTDCKYIKEEYMHIGNMIGDGTMIVMSKRNGKVYIFYDGDYSDHGTFAQFFEYYVEFLSEN